VGTFLLSFVWRYMIKRKEMGTKQADEGLEKKKSLSQRLFEDRRVYGPALVVVAIAAVGFPFVFSMYQTNIMITALLYVILGLGLNIVVGLAGLLDLGYVAFYAVGAYSYALLNYHFGLGFWAVLPIGAAMGALFGILLGFPVLRLRGDYLAIVTLGFGEIIRLILENWNAFSFGPSGIANIPRPGFFGLELNLHQNITYLYFLMIGLTIFTIFVVNRLQASRLGRAWIALREDEIACQAMGIDKTKTKLTAFALGATWAGIGGVIFAAKTTFINPASFTIWESINILCIVVLGGMGSIIGVILGALFLILLPEYLRAFSEYRMLIFGAILVLMMVFRPGGLISKTRSPYKFEGAQNSKGNK
jgi:branched-chain amino acid transport system permease protein